MIKITENRGFTLIELIVVMAVIGVLSTLIINNLNDSRGRARDAQRKQNLNQLKTALRMYYNDYQAYPANSGNTILGCGDGNDACSDDFATTNTVYMNRLPEFSYYRQTGGGDGFDLKVVLENPSDPDLADSQDRCPGSHNDTDYVVCED